MAHDWTFIYAPWIVDKENSGDLPSLARRSPASPKKKSRKARMASISGRASPASPALANRVSSQDNLSSSPRPAPGITMMQPQSSNEPTPVAPGKSPLPSGFDTPMDAYAADGDDDSEEWLTGPTMIQARSSHGSVSWDEHIIFVAGGFDQGRRLSTVEMLRMDKFAHRFDLSKLRWRGVQNMQRARANVLMCHWKPRNSIVAVGSGSNVVESFDPYKNKWTYLPDLNSKSVSASSTALFYDSFGIQNEANVLFLMQWKRGVISNIEFLDPNMRGWQTLSPSQFAPSFQKNVGTSVLRNVVAFSV